MADNEANATGPNPFKAKRGLIAPPGAKGSYGTTYKIDYIPPPLGRYTGVSPNLGLKARVEGTAGKPGELGLGPDAQTQYKTTFKPHGDAYKNKQPYEDRARETHLRPRTGAKVDYTTSYKVWGNGPRLPEGADPQAQKPVHAKVPTDYSLGQDTTTMYHEHYPPKDGDGFATRVTKQAVEGDGRHDMEPYGPLCKSLAHESFQAPPKDAYLRLKTAGDKPRRTIPVGTLKPEDAAKYGLGDEGLTDYQRKYKKPGLEDYNQRPTTGAKEKLLKGHLRPGKHFDGSTRYVEDYPAPPQSMYTGVSANLGLKARVEGTAGKPGELGLGPDAQTQYKTTFKPHGDAYKNKQPYEDRARETHLRPRTGAKVDYTTSYKVWGNGPRLPEGADPQAQKPVHAKVPTDYSLGEDTTTMYHEHYPPKDGDGFATRVTKQAVEGDGRHDMEPYGPLCKSLAHESFQAPPKDAYLRLKTAGDKPRRTIPVGTLKPEDAAKYGLGDEGLTDYQRKYKKPGLEDYNQRPTTGAKEKLLKGHLRPGKHFDGSTRYVEDYPAPPQSMYTGVSANLGLKARVEGTAGKPGELGLGPDAQTQYKTTFKPHGDAYKNKQPYEDRARETHLRPRTGAKVDYTTSYKVWGNGPRLPEGADPQAQKPVHAKVPTDYSLGQDTTTMYHEHYPPKDGDGFATRVTKQAVEGDGRHDMEPYGPLCKSLAHESFQAPPKDAYLRLKTAGDKPRRTIPVGTLKPEDAAKYGLGDEGLTDYQRKYKKPGLEDYNQRPTTGAKEKLLKGHLRPGKHFDGSTRYVEDYPAPPQSMYTGVSANLGLKARVEGTAGKPGELGLGPDAQTQYKTTFKPHGDAYKNKQPYEDRARETHLRPRTGAKVDYTTSYKVWGNGPRLPEGADPQAQKPVHAKVPTDYSLGEDTTTMYHEHYPPKDGDGFATRVTKQAVEGDGRHDMEPYGPLCKSLAHESFQAPPKDAYLRLKTAGDKPRRTIPVGTLKPEDAAKYGLGDEGLTDYQRKYKKPGLEDYNQRPTTGAKEKLLKGHLRPGKHFDGSTRYVEDYPAPPQSMYTGVSANLGLKARVEGTAGKPGELGLGPDAQTQYKTTFKPHGDAYKNKQPYEDRARETHLRPRTGAKVDYTTSYKVWGNGPRLPEGADPQAQKPVHAKVPTDYSLGQDMTTMYHEDYRPPQDGAGFSETVRVTKQTVEGDGRHDMDPYGPLCKSLAHESYQAPPRESYLVLKDKEKMKVNPVGTVPPDRDYGLGKYGDTEYHDQYVPKKIGAVTLRKVD